MLPLILSDWDSLPITVFLLWNTAGMSHISWFSVASVKHSRILSRHALTELLNQLFAKYLRPVTDVLPLFCCSGSSTSSSFSTSFLLILSEQDSWQVSAALMLARLLGHSEHLHDWLHQHWLLQWPPHTHLQKTEYWVILLACNKVSCYDGGGYNLIPDLQGETQTFICL